MEHFNKIRWKFSQLFEIKLTQIDLLAESIFPNYSNFHEDYWNKWIKFVKLWIDLT